MGKKESNPPPPEGTVKPPPPPAPPAPGSGATPGAQGEASSSSPAVEAIDFIDLSKRMIRKNEGCRLYVYNDGRGIPTIGIGRNLQGKGISQAEADYLFANDVKDAVEAVRGKIGFFDELDPVRQAVLVDMCFNLGIRGLLQFRNALAAIEAGDYELAAEEMKNSRWHNQVSGRAIRLEKMILTGEVDAVYSREG